MRKFFVFLLLVSVLPIFSQTIIGKATLTRIFVSIPDSCFTTFIKYQPDSFRMDKKYRREMMDSVIVREHWRPAVYFSALDTVNGYMELISQPGDPEGMTSEIGCWTKTGDTRLVIMTVNYGDMCINEQKQRFYWIDDGKTLRPVNENEVLPAVAAKDFVRASFLRRHKIAKDGTVPFKITLSNAGKSISFSPEFGYLFTCGEYFKDDQWYGLKGKDILLDELKFTWNGNQFILTR